MVIVRRATLDDKPAIFQFYQIAYPSRWQYKIPERWQWEYVDNPFLADSQLPVWIAVEEDGSVVGQTCALVEPLKLGTKVYRVGWSVDTYLLQPYRGQGIGFQLQKANDDANPIFMSLSMSNANRRIKAGLGSMPVDPVPAFTRLVRYEPESVLAAASKHVAQEKGLIGKIVPPVIHGLFLDRFASAGLNLWVRLRDLRLPKADGAIQISQVGHFDAEINRLWEKVSTCFNAMVVRDDVYLNWKYVRQPYVEYQRIIARRNGEICGYLILRKSKPPERNMGLITDLLAMPDDEAAIQTLLSYAVCYFKDAKVKDIQAATTVVPYQACLRKLGFHESRGSYPMFHCKLDSTEEIAAQEPGSWFLGKGDHDWDQFPLAR
ncbi:MAG: N-acetyltransferase family protein [Omnitrophica WOR_2 bacterium]